MQQFREALALLFASEAKINIFFDKEQHKHSQIYFHYYTIFLFLGHCAPPTKLVQVPGQNNFFNVKWVNLKNPFKKFLFHVPSYLVKHGLPVLFYT